MSDGQRMTAEEAVRQIRREAGRLRAVRAGFARVQADIPAPSPEELGEMAKGERAVSPEAHLLGVLQATISQLENTENDLRYAVSAKALSRLEKDWQQGGFPDRYDLRRIRGALSARKA